jgi:hypothetical protein
MEQRLRSVEQLGTAETATILKLPGVAEIEASELTDEEDPAAAQSAQHPRCR